MVLLKLTTGVGMGEAARSLLNETDQADILNEVTDVRPSLTSIETGRIWPEYSIVIGVQNVFGNPPLHTTRDNRVLHIAYRTMEAVKAQSLDDYPELLRSFTGTRPSQELQATNTYLAKPSMIRSEKRPKEQWVDIDAIVYRIWYDEWASHNHPVVQAVKLVSAMNDERKALNAQLSYHKQLPTLKDSDFKELQKDLCIIFQGNDVREEVDLIIIGYKAASVLFHSPKKGGVPVPPKLKNKK